MKNKIFTIILALLLVPSFVFASGANKISIVLNNEVVTTDVEPFLKDNRTFVPVRFISEKLGFKVDWNEKAQLVTITNNNKKIELTIGNKEAKVDGKAAMIDVAPLLKDNRTFVPLRFISENFGVKTSWDAKTYRVILETDPTKELNLTPEEKEYYDMAKGLEDDLRIKFDEMKSYLFDNASKYNETELKEIYEAKKAEATDIIKKIEELKVPDKFKESHNFLLKSMDALKDVIHGFDDSLINKNPKAAKKVVEDLTVFNIRIAEHLKALKANAEGIPYNPDEAIKKYNETKDSLLGDPTIKNLLDKVNK